IVVQNYWPGFSPSEHPIERLFILFVSGVIALTVYNLIKGEELEVKEKQGITSKEISEKLEEMRNKGN
ncbi:MAG: hypothetical protein PQ975_11335, partial [Methanobacterium sp.]